MTDPVVPNEDPTNNDNPTEMTADELLGQIKSKDGRQKYANAEEALKSIAPAQEHIAKVETDNAELKTKVAEMEAELGKRASVEDAVAKILQERQPLEQPSGEPVLDEDRLNQAIASSLSQIEKEKLEAKNSTSVVTTLVAQLGTAQAASDAMDKASKAYGVDIKAMAKTSPASVYKLLGIDPAQTPAEPVAKLPGTVNPLSLKEKPQEPKKLSSLPIGHTTNDMVAAWRAAAKPKT